MKSNPFLKLNDGNQIPQLGFGVFQVPDSEAEAAVTEALKVGYRSIDTAKIYQNEKAVGSALAKTDVPREDLFITTKLWNSDQGYDSALKAFDQSLSKLGLDYLDLYLIHWPSPHRALFTESWKALVHLKEQGRVKSIGVSNFHVAHLEKIIEETGVVPSVNQIELHPRLQQTELREFHRRHGIATESWSPLGQGLLLKDPALNEIAAKHGKSAAQVILRWHLNQGLIVIPKSVTPSRIKENFEVFDFDLDENDLAKIRALDNEKGRIGPHPETATF
jgi:2,5-diketo-D-gluconate reductase A